MPKIIKPLSIDSYVTVFDKATLIELGIVEFDMTGVTDISEFDFQDISDMDIPNISDFDIPEFDMTDILEFDMTHIPKLVIENPIPSKVYGLPQYTQTIQPYEYGHPFQKRTCLWIKGLPNLIPTNIVEERQSTKIPGNWFNKGGKDRQKERARTCEGIADAMADQWGRMEETMCSTATL